MSFATFGCLVTANAATVSKETSVTAEFDVSDLTPAAITRYRFSCRWECGKSGSGDPNNLAARAQVLVKFGTDPNSDDLGSFIFKSPAETDVPNITTSVGLWDVAPLPEATTKVYMTLEYVDDEFDVVMMMIKVSGREIQAPAY